MLEFASSRAAEASPGRAPAAKPAPPRPRAPRPECPACGLEAGYALEREVGVSHVLGQVLVRRGLGDPAAARAFLAADEAYDPEAFLGIGEAVAMIRRH